MSISSEQYWEERAKNRVVRAEMIGVEIMDRTIPIYEKALDDIRKEINKVYINYSNRSGLDVSELTRILSGVEKNNFLKDIHSIMKSLGMNVGEVYDKGYISQLTRLEAIKQQIYWEIQKIAPKEIAVQRNGYKELIRDSYKVAREDVREQLGASTGFFMGNVDKNVVDKLMVDRWEDRKYVVKKNVRDTLDGNTYIRSIENNVILLGRDVRDVVGGGLLSGISQAKMIRQLRERADVGKYNAMRLIRTETSYYENQVELQSYIDEGVEMYKYTAVMDGITSKMCTNMNDTIWRVDEAIVGFNYPPLHPNCRSTTVAIFGSEARKKVQTREPRELVGELSPFERTIDEFATRYRDSSVENGIIVNRRSGEIMESARGTEGDVNFNLRQWNSAEGNVIVHNHPNTGIKTSFSPSDITIGINKRAYQTVVIGKEGRYEMTFGDIVEMEKKRQFEITNEIKEMFIEYLKKFKNVSNEKLNEKLWSDVAKRYGFKYGFRRE